MSEIQQITKRVRHQQWLEEINERINSGLSVKEWCEQRGMTIDGYKYRLRVLRREALESSHSSFVELTEPTMPVPFTNSNATTSVMPGGVSIDISGTVIHVDAGAPETLITAAVRAVRNA